MAFPLMKTGRQSRWARPTAMQATHNGSDQSDEGWAGACHDPGNVAARDFSKRLRRTLHGAGYRLLAPAAIRKEFNIRYAGNPVGTHAVRKWLHGSAIPTQEKIRVLAQWLGVSATWLRFGIDPPDMPYHLTAWEQDLLRDFLSLPDAHQALARDLISMLVDQSPIPAAPTCRST